MVYYKKDDISMVGFFWKWRVFLRDDFPYVVVGSLNKGDFISHLQKTKQKKKEKSVFLEVRNKWILSGSTGTQRFFNKQGMNF